MWDKGSSSQQKSLLTAVDEIIVSGKTKSERWHTHLLNVAISLCWQNPTVQSLCSRGVWQLRWPQLHLELHYLVLNFCEHHMVNNPCLNGTRNILLLSRPMKKPTSYFEEQTQAWTGCDFPPSVLSHKYTTTGHLAEQRNTGQHKCLVFSKGWLYKV